MGRGAARGYGRREHRDRSGAFTRSPRRRSVPGAHRFEADGLGQVEPSRGGNAMISEEKVRTKAPVGGQPARVGRGDRYLRRWKRRFRLGSLVCSYVGSWARWWWKEQRRRALSRSVFPPCDHGVSWWASHQAAGMSQPSVRQCRSRMARALRWAGVKRRWVRPRSRTRVLPSRTAGRMPAVQASRRASLAVMTSPVLVVARPRPVRRASMVDGDDHAGGLAAVDRQPTGVEVLQEGTEGVAEPYVVGRGLAVAGGLDSARPSGGGLDTARCARGLDHRVIPGGRAVDLRWSSRILRWSSRAEVRGPCRDHIHHRAGAG